MGSRAQTDFFKNSGRLLPYDGGCWFSTSTVDCAVYTLWSATVFCFVANKAADPKPNQDDGNIFFNCFELYP